jgi:shikimate kinase
VLSQGTSIFLIGMMGSGKTTTGKMLANVLKYCFFDSDAVIEQAVGGASITEIFAANGEQGFRDMEQAVLSELASYRNCVVATGGGVVARYAVALFRSRTWLRGHSRAELIPSLHSPASALHSSRPHLPNRTSLRQPIGEAQRLDLVPGQCGHERRCIAFS